MCLEKAEKAEAEVIRQRGVNAALVIEKQKVEAALSAEKAKREAAESRCADWAGKWDDAHNAREKAEVSLADARKNEVHLCEQFDILREERNRMNTELQALAIDPNSRENLCQENAMLRNDLEVMKAKLSTAKEEGRRAGIREAYQTAYECCPSAYDHFKAWLLEKAESQAKGGA
jgi:chromosome segregation ATPase